MGGVRPLPRRASRALPGAARDPRRRAARTLAAVPLARARARPLPRCSWRTTTWCRPPTRDGRIRRSSAQVTGHGERPAALGPRRDRRQGSGRRDPGGRGGAGERRLPAGARRLPELRARRGDRRLRREGDRRRPRATAASVRRWCSTRAARWSSGIFPGVTAPIAVVGVSEKGITSVRLTVEQNGGHASTPPPMTATVRLARAITRLNARPFPARLTETNLRMVETLGAHATGPLRSVFVRARRLQPVLRRGVRPAERRDARDRPHHHGGHPAPRQPRRERAARDGRGHREHAHRRRVVGGRDARPPPPGDPGRRRAGGGGGRERAVAGLTVRGAAVGPPRRRDPRRAPARDRDAVHHARRERQPALHRHLRRRLPLHAVRAERRRSAAPCTPGTSTSTCRPGSAESTSTRASSARPDPPPQAAPSHHRVRRDCTEPAAEACSLCGLDGGGRPALGERSADAAEVAIT